jgi:uncharacterized protein
VKDLIQIIVKLLVDKLDKVDLQEVIGEKTTVLKLRVAKKNSRKVIGKEGETALAICTILNATAPKLKKRAVLGIIE